MQNASPSVHRLLTDGVRHHRSGQLDQAVACYGQVIDLLPDLSEVHNNLGMALRAQGRVCDAIASYSRAIDLKPDNASAHYNLGNALADMQCFDAAAACFRSAVRHRPDYAEAHYNLGNAQMALGQPEAACACYDAAITLRPDLVQAHYNLGNALVARRLLDEAASSFQRAIALKPDLAEAHNNLGSTRREQRRVGEAIACFRQALAIAPDLADAHTNLGMALLTVGDFAAGWAEYEWRWRTRPMRDARRVFFRPLWRGEEAAGRTLLIHAEQGFGDTLQFCRYVPLAQARGLRVILLVPPPLVRLLRALPGADSVLAEDSDLPPFDLYCPMLSLPLALGTTLATIPATLPYLQADAAQAGELAARLAAPGDAMRVGIAWAGSPRLHLQGLAAIDQRRSIDPALLAPLCDVPGVRMVSLQKSGPPAPAALPLLDLMPEMTDFADTAALIATLDLVVSVDTAVAHLAAALGKPVWLLDRFDSCWRWLLDRRDSPWYPTLRIYRQAREGDWLPVIAAVAHDLRRTKRIPAC